MTNQDAEIKRMLERGFGQAFQQQIAQLYKVYVGNAPSVAEQQDYTRKGIEAAIEAYRLAMSAVDAWEKTVLLRGAEDA